MRAPLLACTALALAGAGCNHITTRVPGVLDLRSDGSGAPAESQPAKAESRTGFDAILWGDGVQGSGSVTVVDRKYWLIKGLFPIANESATEEIAAATGDGALRNVHIGELYSGWDFGISVIVGIIPVVDFIAPCVMPPLDVTFSGTRVKVAGTGDVAEPPAPTGEPEPPPVSSSPPPAATTGGAP